MLGESKGRDASTESSSATLKGLVHPAGETKSPLLPNGLIKKRSARGLSSRLLGQYQDYDESQKS